MYSPFSRFRGEDDLEAQVAHLSKEMSSLKKALARRGSDAYDGARDATADVYGDLRDRFVDALPGMRKRARAAGDVARKPSPASPGKRSASSTISSAKKCDLPEPRPPQAPLSRAGSMSGSKAGAVSILNADNGRLGVIC